VTELFQPNLIYKFISFTVPPSGRDNYFMLTIALLSIWDILGSNFDSETCHPD
jgi:hypothetical protein